MENRKLAPKQLLVLINQDLHRSIRVTCAENGITMKKFAEDALVEHLEKITSQG